MNDLKKPLNYADQVKRLRTHNMTIEDSAFAARVLSTKNYYRFTGYALQYRISPHNSDYIPGTSFSKIYKICCFDEALRNLLKKYIEIIEVYFRTQISYNFAITKCAEPPHNQHYDRNNYYNQLHFDQILQSFSNKKKYYSDSLILQHHIKNYQGKLPLWAMVEMLSFSDLSKLYACMYTSDQIAIASAVGKVNAKTLKNHLHCLSILRNKCAHAVRLYNTTFNNPPAVLGTPFLRKHPEIINTTLFAYILVLSRRLPDAQHRQLFSAELQAIINEFINDIDFELIGFPINYPDFL